MDTSQINLLSLIGNDTRLKKVAGTGGGEWHGPCPFCGGDDRFTVQPNAKGGGCWSCRQCSPHWGDAIAYKQKRDGLDFKAAVSALGLTLDNWSHSEQRGHHGIHAGYMPPVPAESLGILRSDYLALNDSGWQSQADRFTTDCSNRLWDDAGAAALDYLRKRGLSDAVIGAAELGYNPTDTNAQWGEVGVFLPAGIVIPWEIGGQYYRVNIRRLAPTGERYMQPKGAANGLYGVDDITSSCVVVMVEGEIDALSIRTGAVSLGRRLVPVATGTASGSRLLRWVVAVGVASRVLLAFDTDKAGEDAAIWWRQQLGVKAARLKPTAHDVNDMLKSGIDIADWILRAAPELLSNVSAH